MNLRDCTREQWLAALDSARILMSGNPNRAQCRAEFKAANDALIALLPVGTDHRDLVLEAARYDALNFIGAVCAGLPIETQEAA